MDRREFFSLKLKASICGWQSTWDPPETATHWAAIHKCANEMRERVGKAVMAIEAVNADKSLSAEGKRSKKEKLAAQARDELATAASLGKARELAEQQLQRWASKLAAHVKPPADHAEAVLHAQVREKVAGLQRRQTRLLEAARRRSGDQRSLVVGTGIFVRLERDRTDAVAWRGREEMVVR